MTLITSFSMLVLASWLALPISLLAIAGFANWTSTPSKLNHCWRIAETILVALLITSVVVGLGLIANGFGVNTGLPEIGSALGLYPDGLAMWMAAMVSFVAWIILRYARDYLRGDAASRGFFPWFLVTVASVLILIFTNHLLVLAGAWVSISLALHHLLTLYPDRTEARLAAVQKFFTSRLGDLAVIAAVMLIWRHYGSFRIPEIYALSSQAAMASMELTLASVFLAVAAALKCAQIPFHGWLIRVMEAPTPVSALLHAGVINLGGFLWLRLFPVFDGYTAGHLLLLVVGGTTALVAVFTMMTQTSVKHALVWSTNAQMGFMLFEIALGAYTLALLHLLAHSLYKAHSLLASGRTVSVSAMHFTGRPNWSNVLLACLATAISGTILWFAPGLVESKSILACLLVMAVAATVFGVPGESSVRAKLTVFFMALTLVPLYGLLNLVLGSAVLANGSNGLPVMAEVFGWGLILCLAIVSIVTQLWPGAAWMQRLHRPASQGFYLDRPFEQFTRRWAKRWLAPNTRGQVTDSYRLTIGERS
ncbi:NADH-quinone oxidoreductase subunit L [Marinobacter sp.]|uniref:NADH-quinone oxidoreductase subunit L n=1 Tax=Marinobacter sp. TaxID=50741 RepID=UPI0025BD8965|nr:NADH-quinone oxidoreductase subunit L [Marinobacter sp.]